MPNLSWGIGVSLADFIFSDVTRQVSPLDDLQARQLESLVQLGIKRIRFFAFHRAVDIAESQRRALQALDLMQEYGCEALITLLDGQGEIYTPVTEASTAAPCNTLDYFSARRYKDAVLPAAEDLVGALREHPALMGWELGSRFALRPPVSGDDSLAFMTFVSEVGGAMLNIDPNAYISTGTASCLDVMPEDECDLFAHRLYTLGMLSMVSVSAGTALERAKAARDYAVAEELHLPFYAFDVAFDPTPDSLTEEGEIWKSSNAFAIFVSPDSAAHSMGERFPWKVEYSPERVLEANALAASFSPVRTRTFVVINGPLGVRSSGRITAKRLSTVQTGAYLETDADSRSEADGFIWWRHRAGWSAERALNGSSIYLRDRSELVPPPPVTSDERPQPGSVVTVYLDQDDLPFDVNTLPMRDAMFRLLPVDANQLEWVQYFGNTMFAYRYGKSWGYDSYCQGLHGGFDLGTPPGSSISVRAGVEGVVIRPGLKFAPRRVDIRVGDYLIIYGHLRDEMPRVAPGTTIHPDTVIGTIATAVSFSPHTHIEIRYPAPSFHWILNPLLFMPESMRTKLLAFPTDFYTHPLNWMRWKMPFDQPVVRLAGRVIGPRARF